jgi:hypothetical protein
VRSKQGLLFTLAFFCLLPSRLRAQTLVNSGTCSLSGNTCTITLSLTSGNYLVCGVGTDVDTSTLSCSDNQSNTYSTCHTAVQAPTPNTVELIQCAPIGTTASTTITCTRAGAGGSGACIAAQYSGLAASPLDQVDSGVANSSVMTFVSETTSTTTQATEELIGLFFAYSAPTSCTAANSFAVVQYVSSGGLLCFVNKSVSATGAYQASTTMSASGSGPGAIMTLKASGGGGGAGQAQPFVIAPGAISLQ